MSEKITLDDLFDLLEEMEKGKDRSRTIDSIDNSKVKYMVSKESSMAIDAGITTSLIGIGTVATGTLVGTVGGAGMGVVSAGISALGVGTISALGGATAGAAAGSTFPVLGTIAGAAVGLAAGAFIGYRIKKRDDDKKEKLKQNVIQKQSTIIRDLEMELNEIKAKLGEVMKENARYKYIIGILMANEELIKSLDINL